MNVFGKTKDGMAVQIRKFALTHLSLGSTSFFHDTVLHFIREATPEALHVESLVGPYETQVKLLRRIVKRSRALVVTRELRAADRERDRLVGVIMNTVRANLSNPLARRRAAAQHLRPVLAGFKGMAHHKQTKQSAESRAMVACFDNAENRAQAEELHIVEEIEALRAANERFDAAILEKAREMNELRKLSDIKSRPTRAAARLLYLRITQVVDAYAIAAPSEAVTRFIEQVNGLVVSLADEEKQS